MSRRAYALSVPGGATGHSGFVLVPLLALSLQQTHTPLLTTSDPAYIIFHPLCKCPKLPKAHPQAATGATCCYVTRPRTPLDTIGSALAVEYHDWGQLAFRFEVGHVSQGQIGVLLPRSTAGLQCCADAGSASQILCAAFTVCLLPCTLL